MHCNRCSTEIELRDTGGPSFSGALRDRLDNKLEVAHHCDVCNGDYCSRCFTSWVYAPDEDEEQRNFKVN